MKIRVTDILDEKEKLVSFTSEYGNGAAFWIGALPEVGEEEFVELSLEEVLRPGDFEVVEAEKSGIEAEPEGFLLTAQVVGPVADEILPLEIGDGVVLMEVSDLPEDPPEGGYIRFRVRELNFFPMDL